MNAVGFTARITAGFRAVELQHIADPIISDPLAEHLAGQQAQQIALQDWQKLSQHQGPGKHLRVPARNRIVEDALCEALQQLAAAAAAAHSCHEQQVQVVSIGCGMGTTPWRLQLPAPCQQLHLRWFDVDQPGVIQLKQQLLQEAGAATTPQQQHQNTAGHGSNDSSSSVRFPLQVASWAPVAADLAVTSLADALGGAGFDASCTTVWIAEALIYYLPLHTVSHAAASLGRRSRGLVCAHTVHTQCTHTHTHTHSTLKHSAHTHSHSAYMHASSGVGTRPSPASVLRLLLPALRIAVLPCDRPSSCCPTWQACHQNHCHKQQQQQQEEVRPSAAAAAAG